MPGQEPSETWKPETALFSGPAGELSDRAADSIIFMFKRRTVPYAQFEKSLGGVSGLPNPQVWTQRARAGLRAGIEKRMTDKSWVKQTGAWFRSDIPHAWGTKGLYDSMLSLAGWESIMDIKNTPKE